jgi:hypothetical protein
MCATLLLPATAMPLSCRALSSGAQLLALRCAAPACRAAPARLLSPSSSLPPLLSRSVANARGANARAASRGAGVVLAAAAFGREADNDARWRERVEELKEYAAAHGGSTDVPRLYPSPLARWVNKARKMHKSGKLRAERVAELNALGFVWDAQDARWEARFLELQAYKRAHGTANVPTDRAIGGSLGGWVAEQRRAWRNHTLSEARIAKLQALGLSV